MIEENALAYMHTFLENNLEGRDLALDATLGKGQDSLYLIKELHFSKVYGFDIQNQALDLAKDRLKGLDQLSCIHDGHENLDAYIKEDLDLVCFNLGYLPGGDKSIITKKETTCLAIKKALDRLKEGGLMTILLYRGHPGAKEEVEGVLDLLAGLDQRTYLVHWLSFPNQVNQPAYFLGLQKRKEK